MSEGMTYKGSGVDYDAMDPFKRAAQLAGKQTAANITRLNDGEFHEVETSRGESAYLIEAAKSYFAHVEEGLGTKNLVADAMYRLTGKSYYDHIAQDTVAMIVNDMITLGALPLSVAMHLAVGESKWFDDEKRCSDLIDGWKKACDLARCVWGGGETPTLKDVILPGAVVLSGSALGLVKPKDRLIKAENIQHGDSIILIESSGIHANGLTMSRRIAERKDGFWRRVAHFFLPDRVPMRALPKGYLTELTSGRTYGEALLDPTHIYVGLVEDSLNAGAEVHYIVNITGHGWRKLMRAVAPFVYVIEKVPEPQPVFHFIQERGQVSDQEMYGNFNMGAGFALFVPQHSVVAIKGVSSELGFRALEAGYIEKRGEEKKVVIEPLGLVYDSLNIR